MAYKYGIQAAVKDSIGSIPVTTGSCVVYIGGVYGSSDNFGVPVKCTSYADYCEKMNKGEGMLELDNAAKIAFDKVGIDHAWFVNINEDGESDESDIDNPSSDIIDDALSYICLNSSERPNIICVPGVNSHSGASDLASSLCALCDGKINDLYSAVAVLDCPASANQINNKKAVAANINPLIRNGHLISCWGCAVTERNADGTVKDADILSSVVAAKYAKQDASNTDNVPYRSIGNLSVEWADGLCIKTSSGYTECSARQINMNDVSAKGVVSLANLGNNNIVTWGDHTSAFSDGGSYDVLYQFDSSVRIMIYIFNRFIDQWRFVIDKPMTLALRNDIVNSEQANLDYLVAIGALIGSPKCEFRAESNREVASGHFYFDDTYTAVIPAKYIQLNLTHTSEGLRAYTE